MTPEQLVMQRDYLRQKLKSVEAHNATLVADRIRLDNDLAKARREALEEAAQAAWDAFSVSSSAHDVMEAVRRLADQGGKEKKP